MNQLMDEPETLSAFCPRCRHAIAPDLFTEVGQVFTCPNCGESLDIISLDPPELDWVYAAPLALPQQEQRPASGKPAPA